MTPLRSKKRSYGGQTPKNVVVVGAAKSGIAAAKLLVRHGAHVTLVDEKPRSQLTVALKDLPKGVIVKAGQPKLYFDDTDMVVTSPGVPWDHPQLEQARKNAIPVLPELELAWRYVQAGKTVAITGTNGKTTTTALLGHILKKAGVKTAVGGNIGTPLSDLVGKIDRRTVVVLEVSSYQLEGHHSFHPNVGVFLNLTPDHLKRHGTMAGYAAAKARLFAWMEKEDTAVLNGRDPWCRRVAKKIRATKVFFPNSVDARLAKSIRLPGDHNFQNAMAASAACRALKLSPVAIRAGLASFKGVPHRIELVRELAGARYFNDSKATNVDSTFVALKSFSAPVILILGGEHKGTPYKPLFKLIKKGVKTILTIGEAAPIIARDLQGAAPMVSCGTLRKAIAVARKLAAKGDVVLLSPACASFDQFKNFEHRGAEFTKFVKALR